MNVHTLLAGQTTPVLADLGVRLVRYSLNWHDNPDHPEYWDGELAEYANNGIEVLANVGGRFRDTENFAAKGAAYVHCIGQPGYACIPRDTSGDPAWQNFLADWTAFTTAVISRNASRVKYWSPWNEPNEMPFFNGTEAQYDAMAAAFCRAVRKVREDQGAAVYCAGPEYGIHNVGYQGQIDALAPRVAADSFDVLTLHVYHWTAELDTIARYAKLRIPLPLFITETGIPDPGYRPPAADPELQERDVVQKTQDMRRLYPPGSPRPIDALFFYDLQSGYGGLMNGDSVDVHFWPWRPRPAYYALKKVVAGTYAQPAPSFCSGPAGTVPCDFHANAVFTPWGEHWDCVARAHVTTVSGFNFNYPVVGAAITGYRGIGVYGKKLTNFQGDVAFSTRCDANVEAGLAFAPNGTWNVSTPMYYDGIAFSPPWVTDRNFFFRNTRR